MQSSQAKTTWVSKLISIYPYLELWNLLDPLLGTLTWNLGTSQDDCPKVPQCPIGWDPKAFSCWVGVKKSNMNLIWKHKVYLDIQQQLVLMFSHDFHSGNKPTDCAVLVCITSDNLGNLFKAEVYLSPLLHAKLSHWTWVNWGPCKKWVQQINH